MSGDVSTRLPGAGGAGIDIYTILRPGAGPTPPASSYMLMENGTDKMLMENGTDLMILE